MIRSQTCFQQKIVESVPVLHESHLVGRALINRVLHDANMCGGQSQDRGQVAHSIGQIVAVRRPNSRVKRDNEVPLNQKQ